MTYQEIDRALCEIVTQKYHECQERLDAVPKENKNERKALTVEREMYGLFHRAGLLVHVSGNREQILSIRNRFIFQKHPRLSEIFSQLDKEEKMRFCAALQAEIFMRDTFFCSYVTELQDAKASGDITKIFEFEIKVGSLNNIFSAWEAWREKNNVYPKMFLEGLT